MRKIEKYSQDFDFNTSDFKSLLERGFFTDTHNVETAIDTILSGFARFPEQRQVRISAHKDIVTVKDGEELDILVLEILHIDSFCDQDINGRKVTKSLGGDFTDIRNSLMSLCDWSVESRYYEENPRSPRRNVYCRIDYLKSGSKENDNEYSYTRLAYACEGFKHILKFRLQ